MCNNRIQKRYDSFGFPIRDITYLIKGAGIRELKKTMTATATGTSLNKRFNEQNNGCARAL